jgi:hypothetical protein
MFVSLGELVEGISGISSDPKSCHLSIKTLTIGQLGTWTCKVQLVDTPFFLEAFFTATTEIRVSDVRLPKHLKPEKYSAFLTPFIAEGNFTIQGHVHILIKVLEPSSNNITLHIKDMKIFENTVSVKDSRSEKDLKIIGFGYDDPRQFFIIKLDEKLSSGQTINVSIGFLGELNDDLSGFYRSSYFEEVKQAFI